MEDTLRQRLNQFYRPMDERMRALSAALARRGLAAEGGWFSGHYTRDSAGQYHRDDFPIPVVTVKGVCDVELGPVLTTVSARLGRDAALALSPEELEVPFEAYGAEDYLLDLYLPGMAPATLAENIRACGEREIGFSFCLPPDAPAERVLALIEKLARWGFCQ